MKSDLMFVLDTASWPALLVEDSGTVRRASEGAKALFGTVLEGAPSLSAIWAKENETAAELFLQKWERSPSSVTALKFRVKDGSIVSYQVHIARFQTDSKKVYVLQLFKTEPSSNEATAHKQKLDCALQLTRTVALDFNNALTSILGHTSLILGQMQPDNPYRNSLVEVEKSAEKAAEIAHDLAAFSRQEKDAKNQQTGNLNELVRRSVELFKTPAYPNLFWGLNLEAKLFSATFDEAKMQQAFVKVLDNAVQAVPAGGRIVVTTTNVDINEPRHDGNVTIAPGSYVCVEFSDSGCGIPKEVLPRIFEPFFTTKNNPANRGLGLAWVYGIVTNHGGSVAVSSEVDVGTSVRIYLPAHKRIVKDRTVKPDDLSGNHTVLMIDDEDLMLTMGETVLSAFGYRVLTANSGEKGLAVFARNAREIDLVITDLVMPQMSGRELIEELRKISPDVPVICASGFVRNANTEEDEMYLQKPFTTQELLRKVKQVLSSQAVA
ncbi:MAG: ATP-binding protein [Verrucomicrobiota bacterium]|nr:ATP-binding protein [Verrucomicrobiota bacterium]